MKHDKIPIKSSNPHWSRESLLRIRDAIALLLLRVVGATGKFATCHVRVLASSTGGESQSAHVQLMFGDSVTLPW